MSERPTQHPDKDVLVAFGLGRLEPDKATTVEAHLEQCTECCDTLLDLKDDTFVALVRQASESDPATARTEGRVDDGSVDATVVLPSGSGRGSAVLPAELTEHPRYHVVELIGSGGMGDVYKAEHRLMHRTVALKVINRELVRNAQAVERFRREVQAAARLAHPNIVTAHDAEQAGDVHYLVMEYVDGTDLAEMVKEHGPLDIPQACEYIRQAAVGLQHAHEQGMVHRDIKPHNLMVTAEGQVKILDFGLATLAVAAIVIEGPTTEVRGQRSEDGGGNADSAAGAVSPISDLRHPAFPADPRRSTHLTTAGTMMGTPDFISPEQAGDAHSVDTRSDIYSLGCTLYYVLTGRPPFDEGTVMDRVKAHADCDAEPIENIRVDIPAELAEVIRRMMAKDPADRFQTPAEAADALAPFVDEHRTDRAGSTPAASSSRGAGRRRWPRIAAILTPLVIGLAGIVYVATDNGTLVIESDDDNVEIMIGRPTSDTQEGMQLKFVDRVTGSEVVRLPSGHYRLSMGWGPGVNENVDVQSLQLSREQFVLKRGDKVIVRVTQKASTDTNIAQPAGEIPPQPAASPETQHAFQGLVTAAVKASTDEEWEAVLTEHAPMLAFKVPEGGGTEKFGEAEMAQMRKGGRRLVEVLAGLPDHVQQDLLQAGYLKWRFAALDEPRQAAMQDALSSVFAASSKMGFPMDLKARVPEMLASGDVGFAVLDTPQKQGQMVVWYLLMPSAPIPIMFPILGVSQDGDAKDDLSASIYRQLGTLEDKTYSDLMPLLKPADMERLQGVWTFVRGEANGEPATPRTLEIAANVWLMKDPQTGQTLERMTFDIDPTQDPKQITLSMATIPQPMNAIYRIVDDELHVTAASAPGGERPTQFDEGGEGKFFVIMRREPPPDVKRMNMEAALKQSQEQRDPSQEIAYAVWESDGKAVLRFADWYLIFEGIDAAPGLKGLGSFRVPDKQYDDSNRTGGGATFGTNNSPLKLTIDDRNVDGVSTVSVNDFQFKMEGRAEKLTFGEATYTATGDVQQIIYRADGTTQLRADGLLPGSHSSNMKRSESRRVAYQIPDTVLQAFEQSAAQSGPTAFLMWDADGSLGILSEHWCLIFEGVAYERKTTLGVGEGSGFSRPDQIVSTNEPFETTFSSGGNELAPQIRITQSIADGVNNVNVAGYRFRLEGAAEKLTFKDSTYTASDTRHTIVIRPNGTTASFADESSDAPTHALQVDGPTEPHAVLDQFTGTWAMELTANPTPQLTRKVTSKHTMQTEWTLGGRMEQSYSTSETGDEEWLIVRAFDETRQMYRAFLFGSTGVFFERTSQWNPQDQTMRYTLVPPAAGVTGMATDVFLDPETLRTTLRVKNAKGELTRDVDGYGRRASVDADIDLPATSTPAEEVPELTTLQPLIGHWNVHCVMRPCALDPSGGTEERTEIADWILGGRFLRGRSIAANGELAALYIMGWLPQEARFRTWHFEFDGSIGLWRVTWDEAARSFDWQALETPPGWIGTVGSVQLIDDDTTLMSVRIEDQQGRVMMDYEQRRQRINE